MDWSLKLGMCFPLKLLVYLTNHLSSILCGDHAIKQIDKPFIGKSETAEDWAL